MTKPIRKKTVPAATPAAPSPSVASTSSPRRRSEPPASSTKRVQRFRKNRLLAGGSELSLFLPPEASVALDVILSIKDIRHKVGAAGQALIAEARRLAPNEERVKALVAANRLEPKLAKKWLRTMKSLQFEREYEKRRLNLQIRKKSTSGGIVSGTTGAVD